MAIIFFEPNYMLPIQPEGYIIVLDLSVYDEG